MKPNSRNFLIRFMRLVLCCWIILLFCPDNVNAAKLTTTDDFPYELSLMTDLIIAPLGVAVLTSGLYLKSTMERPTQEEIEALNRKDVSEFDRFATRNWNESADIVSDVTQIVIGTAPVWLLIPQFMAVKKRAMNLITILLMYGETAMLAMGFTALTKALAKRPRPFMYNENVPFEEKKDRPYTSFFSGHTTFGFCGAVFVSTVVTEIYPKAPLRVFVWIMSLSLASLNGYLRIDSGNHFPTDVIAGAAVGSLFGFLVPFLHKKSLRKNKKTTVSLIPQISREKRGVVFTLTF